MKQAVNPCESYLRDAEQDKAYYDIFFQMCRKFRIDWASASEKEKAFLTEVTRVTYERRQAQQAGLPLDTVQPAFSGSR